MNFEFFFAKKIIRGGKNSFSKPIIRISIIAIALGIAMMTLSLSIVQGFQEEIQKKVIGFGAHILITTYDSQGVLEAKPISTNRPIIQQIKELNGVNHVQAYTNKGLILKTKENNYGAILKGIDQDYKWTFFEQYIIKGDKPYIDSSKRSNEVLISSIIASKLKLQVGDDVLAYFVQQPPRMRKFVVSGIYNTGLGEMDETMILGDLKHIQKLNDWEDHQVSGFEVLIDDMEQLTHLDQQIYKQLDYDLTSTSIKDNRPDIFNWLELQDINVIIIISLLILVCGIDIISALLILILERTRTIGILKAVGAKDTSIRKIFIYNAAYLIIAGLVIGNIIGLGLSILQLKTGFMTLPQEAYFIDKVPIKLNFINLILLNISTLVCCLLMLLLPSFIITKLSPIKAIRFD